MSQRETDALRRDLAAIVGARHVTTVEAVRASYGRDAWPRALIWEQVEGTPRFKPDVVVWPHTTGHVAAIVKFAREHHVPITPFGGGTGVVAGAVPLKAGITLDFKRMRGVVAIQEAERRVVAQAGIVGQALEDALAVQGLTTGHLPASLSSSTLGGWVATRAVGQYSANVGSIDDLLLGVTAVAGTGDVLRIGPERRAGPDLLQFVCGSEGTLALVTEATLAVHAKPTELAPRAFRMRSFRAGLTAMRQILRAGLRPHVLRLFDPFDSLLFGGREAGGRRDVPTPLKAAIGAMRARAAGPALVAPGLLNRAADLIPERCLLVVSFEGTSKPVVDAGLDEATALIEHEGGTDLGEGPARRWYRRRFSIGFKQPAVYLAGAWTDTLEAATTWDRVPALVAAVRSAVAPHAFVTAHVTHAWHEGCAAYFTFIGSATSLTRAESTYDATWRSALDAVRSVGATASHHHGIGALKARALPEELGDAGMRSLRALKSAFDPDGILNPGKLLA